VGQARVASLEQQAAAARGEAERARLAEDAAAERARGAERAAAEAARALGTAERAAAEMSEELDELRDVKQLLAEARKRAADAEVRLPLHARMRTPPGAYATRPRTLSARAGARSGVLPLRARAEEEWLQGPGGGGRGFSRARDCAGAAAAGGG
jgi:hypothetical protein